MTAQAGWVVAVDGGVVNVGRAGDDAPHLPGADCWCGVRLALATGGRLLVLHTSTDGSWIV